MIGLLLAVTVTFHPAAPTVGDQIHVRFPAAVVLEAQPSYEIVSVKGSEAVVRTFTPSPIVLKGRAGNVRFEHVVIPVTSVLRKKDALQPAPLTPPRPLPRTNTHWFALGAAALLAAATWLLAWRLSRPRARVAVPAEPPHERYRRVVEALRSSGAANAWVSLADETRRFLAATRPSLGVQLTTTEVLRRVDRDEELIRTILSQGDLEKFSPWGSAARDFDDVAERALQLARPELPDEEHAA